MAQTANVSGEIMEYLAQKGVMDRLERARQMEREDERGRLLAEIQVLRIDEEAALSAALARQRIARAQVEDAELALAEARRELHSADQSVATADASYRIGRRTNQLAHLADPRIREAMAKILRCQELVRRDGLVVWTSSEKSWDLAHRIREEHSNADQVAELLAILRLIYQELESLLYEPRPENLADILETRVVAAVDGCRRAGVSVDFAATAAGGMH